MTTYKRPMVCEVCKKEKLQNEYVYGRTHYGVDRIHMCMECFNEMGLTLYNGNVHYFRKNGKWYREYVSRGKKVIIETPI